MKISAQQAMGMAWAITQHGQDVMIKHLDHWLELDFFTIGKILCVWDTTGSVYELEDQGNGLSAVADDPVFTPGDYERVTLPNAKLLRIANQVADERDKYKRELEELRAGRR